MIRRFRNLACAVAAISFLWQPPGHALELIADGKPVIVRSKQIKSFEIGRETQTFGKLTFLGGLELVLKDRKAGGISGLLSLENGATLLAVNDNGHWISISLQQSAEGVPIAVTGFRYAPLRGAKGKTLVRRWGHDTEALARDGNDLYVSAEQNHAIYHYRWPVASGEELMTGSVWLPERIKKLPRNEGLEALAAVPENLPEGGKLLAVAESSASDLHDLSAFLIGPDGVERLQITRSGRYGVTDAAFLPNGDLVLLERRFSLRDLIGMRLRRFEGKTVKAGARLTGEVLLEADFGFQIDNMEALAVHQNLSGETILTLMSDDNRSFLQRTLLLRFRLDG